MPRMKTDLTPSNLRPRNSIELADSFELADDDLPELDTSSTEDVGLDLEGLDSLEENIIGDTDGNDYRAGTVDPDGSDRGPYKALSTDLLEDIDLTRPH